MAEYVEITETHRHALYTHVECLCGTTAAIPEGGIFPLCARCGRRMVCPDPERVTLLVAGATADRDPIPGRGRRYSDAGLLAGLEARKMPTEPQDWPQVDPGDGGLVAVPPWEAR
jgi:hypothetical protein